MKAIVPFIGIGGSVVECSPATRAARVRFPADATLFQSDQFNSFVNMVIHIHFSNHAQYSVMLILLAMSVLNAISNVIFKRKMQFFIAGFTRKVRSKGKEKRQVKNLRQQDIFHLLFPRILNLGVSLYVFNMTQYTSIHHSSRMNHCYF